MYRSLSAFLLLLCFFVGAPLPASAKPAVSTPEQMQKSPSIKQIGEKKPATTQTGQHKVRTQSIVIPRDDESAFVPPEGALYTTSDDCA